MGAFEKLAQPIQRALHDARWKELRPIQTESIYEICDRNGDLIVAAATASGKTEAAFLPILSQIEKEAHEGVAVIYVAPLKALINDQLVRLQELTVHCDLKITPWHGDISATRKKALRKEPSGILLITPESLESCFINYGRDLHRMFADLRYVIIDELHAFLSDVRGVHLASLLSRVEMLTRARPRRIGLSATLSDFSRAKDFLNRARPDQVTVVEDKSSGRSVRIGLRAYPNPSKTKAKKLGPTTEISALARELTRVFRRGSNLVFTNSRSLAELLTEEIHQISLEESWRKNPFAIHHGSLSKEVREETEQNLKRGEELTVFCTSTLEMGIDIGSVKAVGQLTPPWSVASLVQRLGRSGRGEGEDAILRMYALDRELSKDSQLDDRLRPELLRSIAIIELIREKWLEPPPKTHLQLSTFVQQILSILRQTGGVSAAKIYAILCSTGVFSAISPSTFKDTLRSLASHDLIEQTPNGLIILAPEGERVTHDRDFYAAFISSDDFAIQHRGETIGKLPSDTIPPVGENLILNGRRWEVEEILSASRVAHVVPTRAKKPPLFFGEGGLIDRRIHQEMLAILQGSESFPYLHQDASAELKEARSVYEKSGLDSRIAIRKGCSWEIFPWAGTLGNKTLALCAVADGLACQTHPISISYSAISLEALRDHLERVANGVFHEKDLADILPDKHIEKYDVYLEDSLLSEINQQRSIALDDAQRAARDLLTQA